MTNGFTTPVEVHAAVRQHEPGLPCWCDGFTGPFDIPIHVDDRVLPGAPIIAAPRDHFEGWFRP